MVVFALAVVFAIAFPLLEKTPAAVAQRKLESDVRTVNAAIDVFRVFGGEVDSAATPSEVIEKLREQSDEISAGQTLGLSSSFVDRRLKAVMQTGAEAQSGQPRAIWDPVRRHFVVKTGGSGGVAKFIVDDSLPSMAVFTDKRAPNAIKISRTSDWIWDYTDRDASGRLRPTDIYAGYFADPESAGSGGAGGGGGGGGGGAGGAGGPGSSAGAVALSPPGFSRIGGQYPVTDYDFLLTLGNPNPAGVSRIVYRINSGGWIPYVELPIPIGSDTVVTAFCETIDEDWLNSAEVSHAYAAQPVKLKKPKVKNNNGHGNNLDGVDVSNPGNGNGGPNGSPDPSGSIDDEKKWVEVYLESENDPGTEQLESRVNGGVWKKYNGTFFLFQDDYPLGVIVDARAQAVELYYQDSSEDRARLSWLDPVPFDHPGLTSSVTAFGAGAGAEALITISNPNDPTLSATRYRVGGGDWQVYSGPVTLSAGDHTGSSSVMVEAQIVGTLALIVGGETLSLPSSGVASVTIGNP